VSDEEKAERHRSDTPNEVGGSIHDSQTAGQRHGTDRMGQIDLKDPAHTYNVSIRAATSLKDCAENLTDSLNHLSGRFYSIEGEYLGQNEYEYKRMLAHGITYPNGFGSQADRNHSPSVTSKSSRTSSPSPASTHSRKPAAPGPAVPQRHSPHSPPRTRKSSASSRTE